MRLVQSQAIIALPTGRPQKGGGIKKLAFALSLACLFAPASARAQNAYITNSGGFNWVTGSGNPGNTVSVIDTATNTVVGSPITVGTGPIGVAVTPDGSKVYVANYGAIVPRFLRFNERPGRFPICGRDRQRAIGSVDHACQPQQILFRGGGAERQPDG